MLETLPRPHINDLPTYYQSEEYISHTDSKKGLVNFLYQTVKNYALKGKTGLIKRCNSGAGSLLDIGAGTGEFLLKAKERNWEVTGVEVDEAARNLSEKKGVKLYDSLDKLKGQQFDVVTLWHVLEHLPNLNEALSDIEGLVKKGGTLIAAVPNFNSYDAKYYKSHWAAYDVPRHLWHFSQDSMRFLFSSKMKLTKKKGMIFDSFYVSLLSEKYKSGNRFSIKAILIGLWSNLLALKKKEYSSLIYIFKKAN